MNKVDIRSLAAGLPEAWKSIIVGSVGPVRIKALRMDAMPYGEESHEYNEALLVVDGKMELEIGGALLTVEAGELLVVEAGVAHSVRPGSYGALMIVDV